MFFNMMGSLRLMVCFAVLVMARNETATPPVNYAMVLFPGFQALDVFGPLDALNLASMKHPIKLSMIGPSMEPVSTKPPPAKSKAPEGSDFGESVVPTHTYDDPPSEIDVLIVPGGIGTYDDANIEPAIQLVSKLYPSTAYTFSVCSGSGVLARAGILDGKNATTNKNRWDVITKSSSKVNWIKEARWVEDGNIWTTSGISAGIDGMLGFLGSIYGDEYAKGLANQMEYRWTNDPSSDPFASPSKPEATNSAPSNAAPSNAAPSDSAPSDSAPSMPAASNSEPPMPAESNPLKWDHLTNPPVNRPIEHIKSHPRRHHRNRNQQ